MRKKIWTTTLALALLWPAAASQAQDATPLTSRNGCHRFTLIGGGLQLVGEGVATGDVVIERQHDGQRYTMEIESWGAGLSLVDLAGGTGGSDPAIFVNWRLRENGVKGTERGATVVAAPDPAAPTEFPFVAVTETLQGNRYKTGGIFARAVLDVATGAIDFDEVNVLWCRDAFGDD